MKNETYIKAKSDNKIYRGDSGKLEVNFQDEILFETEQGQETGIIVQKSTKDNFEVEETEATIIRKLTDKDQKRCEEMKKEALVALPICQEKIKKHNLPMDLLDADISYDGKKITFYFSSPSRVDFRSLVPDLASTFKKLIRLQQVGSRDKAKCLHGVIGRCGREVCCRSFEKNSDDVNIEMANVQNIGQMGSNRVTGACGKLMCCLKFELQAYQKAKMKMPEVGNEFKTKEGVGIVISQNVIKNKVLVELKEDKKILEVDC